MTILQKVIKSKEYQLIFEDTHSESIANATLWPAILA